MGECHCFRRAQRIENIAAFLLRRCHLPSTIRLKLRSSSNDDKCHLPALEVRSQSGLVISSIPTLLTLEQCCPLTELLLPARKASNESSLPSTPGGCIPRHYWASRILFIIYFVPVVQKSLCVLDSSILTLYLPALCHKQGSETERRSQRFWVSEQMLCGSGWSASFFRAYSEHLAQSWVERKAVRFMYSISHI